MNQPKNNELIQVSSPALEILEERLKKLETSSGIKVPKDELEERIREVMKEFNQGD